MLPALLLLAGAVSAPLRLPLVFEPNRGQAPSEARFLAHGDGYTVLVTAREIVFRPRGERRAVRLRPVGANLAAVWEPLELLPGRVHYFRGSDPAAWRRDLPTYGRLRCRGLYPGIDLVLYGAGQRLEYDFEVAPGADFLRVEMEVEGARHVRLDANGDLVIGLGTGTLRQHRPAVYQPEGEGRRVLRAGYRLHGRRIGFDVAGHDPTRPLSIDPVLSYATYFGGSGSDRPLGLAVDAGGNAYMAGVTDSPNLPATVPARGYDDAFVVKLNPAGTALLYSVYIGGSSGDRINAIAVDSAGRVILTGETTSPDFPTTRGALRREFAGGLADAFFTWLSASGSEVLYSTYLGGWNEDVGHAVTFDRAEAAYVTGRTSSSNFPLTHPVARSFAQVGSDVFVCKFTGPAPSTDLMYSTFFGGSGSDVAYAIQVDILGNVYLAGETYSDNIPVTTGAYQGQRRGTHDVLVLKLNARVTDLVYATYLGGSSGERAQGLALDASGSVYVTGWTESPNFPVTPDAYQTSLKGPRDAFLAKLSPDGRSLLYSTYLGGRGADTANAALLDAAGHLYLAGETASSDFPTTFDALQTELKGSTDAFVTKLKPGAAGIAFSSFLGSEHAEAARAIALYPDGSLCLAGETGAKDFPATPDAWRTTFAGGPHDAFVAKISLWGVMPPRLTAEGVVNAASSLGGAVAPGEIVTIYGTDLGPAQMVTARPTAAGFFDTVLADTRVWFDEAAAPLVYVSAGQLSAIAPYSLAPKISVRVQVHYQGIKSNLVTLLVAPSAPGIFTQDASGKGQAAALNQDYSLNGASNPAARGSVVMVFCTGEGQTKPPGVDGKLAAGILPAPTLPVSARIDGLAAEVLYAGGAPGLVAGVLQVNVRIPPAVTPGSAVPIVVQVGNTQSQPGVTLAVR